MNSPWNKKFLQEDSAIPTLKRPMPHKVLRKTFNQLFKILNRIQQRFRIRKIPGGSGFMSWHTRGWDGDVTIGEDVNNNNLCHSFGRFHVKRYMVARKIIFNMHFNFVKIRIRASTSIASRCSASVRDPSSNFNIATEMLWKSSHFSLEFSIILDGSMWKDTNSQ